MLYPPVPLGTDGYSLGFQPQAGAFSGSQTLPVWEPVEKLLWAPANIPQQSCGAPDLGACELIIRTRKKDSHLSGIIGPMEQGPPLFPPTVEVARKAGFL